MSLAAGALSQISVASNTAKLQSAPATGGTGPYTYQWYRSTSGGFSPGGGSLIAGAIALVLNDSGLVPNTPYFYKVVATDTGNSNATANSGQLAVTTGATQLQPNQLAQSEILGTIDMRFPFNTISVQIDSSQAGSLYAGQAVKMVNSVDGVPKVVACTAATDAVLGFINYDIKTVAFQASMPCEISMAGNVVYLYASAAIARGAQVALSVVSPGLVAPLIGSGAANIVGWALDGATAYGQLIRIFLKTPSFLADGA